MSGPVCALCAQPTRPDNPLKWGGRDDGELVHRVECTYDPIPETHTRCVQCERAKPTRAMLHAEMVWTFKDSARHPGYYDVLTSYRPHGSPVPKRFVPVETRAAAVLDSDDPGWISGTLGYVIANGIDETWDDEADEIVESREVPWLVCPACAEALGGEWKPAPRSAARGTTPAPQADPWPADETWRTREELQALLRKGERTVRDLTTAGVADGSIEVMERKTPGGGKPTKLYRKVPR